MNFKIGDTVRFENGETGTVARKYTGNDKSPWPWVIEGHGEYRGQLLWHGDDGKNNIDLEGFHVAEILGSTDDKCERCPVPEREGACPNCPLKQEFSKVVDELHPAAKPFAEILLEALRLHAKKSKDYGSGDDPYANVRASADYGVPSWVGSLIRANDKWKRIQKFANGSELQNESVEDSLIDLCVYLPIILMLYREESNGVSAS